MRYLLEKMNISSWSTFSILIALFWMVVIAIVQECEADKTDEILQVPHIIRTAGKRAIKFHRRFAE